MKVKKQHTRVSLMSHYTLISYFCSLNNPDNEEKVTSLAKSQQAGFILSCHHRGKLSNNVFKKMTCKKKVLVKNMT